MAGSEQWRPVVGYETSYEVSSFGAVRSLGRKVNSWCGGRMTKTKTMKPKVGNSGYYEVHLAKQGKYAYFLVHRLIAEAFGLFENGKPLVDHINGNKLDNRIENLRAVTVQENTQNQRKAAARSRTGFLGVSFERQTGKFKACIGNNGRYTTLGRFTTPEAAHAAYVDAKRRMHAACSI